MMILLYSNRKTDPIAWDASTREQKAAAFLALFEYLRDEWQVYDELREPLPWDVDKPSRQHVLFQRAQLGDADAAERLLQTRKTYEYEYWQIVSVTDPLKRKRKAG
jgi:hypothetical protein